MGRRGDRSAPCMLCAEEGVAVGTFGWMDIARMDAVGMDAAGMGTAGIPLGTGGRCSCTEVAAVTGGRRRAALPRGPPAVPAAVLLMLRCRRLCLPCAVFPGV